MTPVLIDTHIFLWAVAQPGRLSPSEASIFGNPDVRVHLSAASAWELAIKSSVGKLSLPCPVSQFVAEGARSLGVYLLPIGLRHMDAVQALPRHHRDPFDRMLVAQATTDRLRLLTHDRAISAYDVELFGR